MSRIPTEKQYHKLFILGSGSVVLTATKGDFGPLLRRGWVEPSPDFTPHKGSRLLPPLRITPDGLRALADAIDHYGWPARKGPKEQAPKEPPRLTKLRDQLTETEGREREARERARRAELMLHRVKREVEAIS